MDTTNPYNSPESSPFSAQAPLANGAEVQPRPWGPWATLGWTAFVLMAMWAAQVVVAMAWVVGLVGNRWQIDPTALNQNGNLVASMLIAGLLVVVGLVVILCHIRDVPIADYLALKLPTGRQTVVWLAGLAIYILAADLTTYASGRPIVSEFMTEIYATCGLPLLLVMLLLAAPLSEETLMRGFMITGIERSRWGAGWAIFLSSAVWAALHMQYGLFEIGLIFIMGVFLGAARHITGSLPLTILLHCVANGVATVEAMIAAA